MVRLRKFLRDMVGQCWAGVGFGVEGSEGGGGGGDRRSCGRRRALRVGRADLGLEGSKRASPVGLLSGPSGGLVALAQIVGRIELPAMRAPSVPDTWARRFVPRSIFF